MRRIATIGISAVLTGLVLSAVAYAAFNSYGGSRLAFAPKVAGRPARPGIVNLTETLKADAPNGNRPAPLTRIVVKVYGIQTNGNLFPTCTDSRIKANKTQYELACPSRSRIQQGPVHALLGPASDPSKVQGSACNPFLKVFNGGRAKQVFFFTTTIHTPNPRAYTCANLPTGETAPFDGRISYQGKWWILDIRLPPDVSTRVANAHGVYVSLIRTVLSPIPETTKVAGKTRGYMESVACQGKKRPYSIALTAKDYNSNNSETQTVSGSAPC